VFNPCVTNARKIDLETRETPEDISSYSSVPRSIENIALGRQLLKQPNKEMFHSELNKTNLQ
jgi:hypothetical protein